MHTHLLKPFFALYDDKYHSLSDDASGAYPFSDIAGERYDFSHTESLLWNKLYKRCIDRIRSVDPYRWILVGSNGQNSVVYLKELEMMDDPAVFYNFHYY